MQKRGQIYLLTVIILAFVIYLLYTDTNIVKRTILDDDFEELSQNYDVESAKFVNYLLTRSTTDQTLTDNSIRSYFEDFTSFFKSYSKTKNSEFGLLYLFDFRNKLYIGNYLDEDVRITKETPGAATIEETLVGCSRNILAGFKVAGSTWSVSGIKVGSLVACTKQIGIPDSGNYHIKIRIADVQYEVQINKGKPDIVIVGREEKGNQRKVYTKGNFIEAGPIDLEDENE